jgi:hypothetical protein
VLPLQPERRSRSALQMFKISTCKSVQEKTGIVLLSFGHCYGTTWQLLHSQGAAPTSHVLQEKIVATSNSENCGKEKNTGGTDNFFLDGIFLADASHVYRKSSVCKE